MKDPSKGVCPHQKSSIPQIGNLLLEVGGPTDKKGDISLLKHLDPLTEGLIGEGGLAHPNNDYLAQSAVEKIELGGDCVEEGDMAFVKRVEGAGEVGKPVKLHIGHEGVLLWQVQQVLHHLRAHEVYQVDACPKLRTHYFWVLYVAYYVDYPSLAFLTEQGIVIHL